MREEIDAEVAALAEFSRRMTRGRRAVGIPCIAGGVAIGGAAFWWVQKTGPDGPPGLMLAVLAFIVPFGLSLAVGVFAARRYTAGARDAWVAELAKKHGLDEDELRERAEMFE